MSTLRLLHLSDIHFSHLINDERVEHDDVRHELVQDAAELSRREGNIDGILIAGDVTFGGQRSEYVQAADWLAGLANAVGCELTAVFPVPGNHDVNIERVNELTSQIHRYYRGLPLAQLKQNLSRLARSDEYFLIEKLRDYHDFASSYGHDFLSPSSPCWVQDWNFGPGRTLRIRGLTSVQISDLEDKEGGLVLGANQYIFDDEDGVEQLVIMHHPFEWLKDRRDAESYICNRARIIVSGHEHLARIQKITNEADCDRLFIESGAVTPPDAAAPYIYHYNLICVTLLEEDAQSCLLVRVHPRIWSLERTCFVADRGRTVRRDFAEYTLRCPQYGPNAMPNANPASTIGSDAGSQSSEMNTRQMNTLERRDHDVDFARLRYMFWRHLDWGQRMQTLVRVDALPDIPTSPLPQAVERIALNQARERGRLAELWDVVMNFVPEAKREANPFRARN
jgi:predicted phosphodiesterase